MREYSTATCFLVSYMPFIVYKKCVALETEKANFLKILFLTLKLFRKMISTSNQNTEFQGFFAIKMAEVF